MIKLKNQEAVPCGRAQCCECGKSYDYDEDGFCPRCGTFNRSLKNAHINADGSVVRMDGLNEVNHVGSFVHRELHEENRERRDGGLSKGMKCIEGGAAVMRTSASQRPLPRWEPKERGKTNRVFLGRAGLDFADPGHQPAERTGLTALLKVSSRGGAFPHLNVNSMPARL